MRPEAARRGVDVLLVEDDPALAAMYRIKLLAEGDEVRMTTDGPSGLTAALERPPNLLLLDIRLPGFDGLELLARLRQVSGGDAIGPRAEQLREQEVIDRGQELGVLDHLIKSQITPAELVETIRRHLAAPEARVPAAR